MPAATVLVEAGRRSRLVQNPVLGAPQNLGVDRSGDLVRHDQFDPTIWAYAIYSFGHLDPRANSTLAEARRPMRSDRRVP